MDSFTGGSFAVVVGLAFSVSVVTGLRCYSCVYLNLQTSNENVRGELSAILASSRDGCRENVDKNTKDVSIHNCTNIPLGRKAVCGKLAGTADLSVLSVDVKLELVHRGCIYPLLDAKDSCRDPDNADKNEVEVLLRSQAVVSKFTGTSCGCSGDLCNGQQKVTAETLCWLAGFLLAFSARHWW